MAVAIVAQHIVHNLGYLLLQFVDKLCGVVLLMLDVAQLLLPDTRQLATLHQFFMNGVD